MLANELNKTEIPISEQSSFSRFYSKKAKQGNIQSINELLPLHHQSVNTPAMVRHCMGIIQQLTGTKSRANSCHNWRSTSLCTRKGGQWTYPEKFKNIMWFMGPLHFEMVLGSVTGQWLGRYLHEVWNKPSRKNWGYFVRK